MGRRRKDFKRKTGLKDAKLYVIAFEGQKTEEIYFNQLMSAEHFASPKVHIEILPRNSRSSPEYVIEELNKFKRAYSLRFGDELWMVIDVDRWGDEKISQIVSQCLQKNYNTAISNPCFELWLLLHIAEIDNYNKGDVDKFSRNCSNIKAELKSLLGGYNSSNIDAAKFIPGVENAVSQAKNICDSSSGRWPQGLGTDVYKLVVKLIRA